MVISSLARLDQTNCIRLRRHQLPSLMSAVRLVGRDVNLSSRLEIWPTVFNRYLVLARVVSAHFGLKEKDERKTARDELQCR